MVAHMTMASLASIRKFTGVKYELIIVDNEPSYYIRDEYDVLRPDVYIRLEKDIGCYASYNLGAAVSRGDVLVFIQNDVFVHEGWLQGSILGDTGTPYANDTSINRGEVNKLREVDIIIRTYFVPTVSLTAGIELRSSYRKFPKRSLDDVFLCLGNKYLNGCKSFVIPINEETDLTELQDGGVGQSFSGQHYKNRNDVCRKLMDIYENNNHGRLAGQ